MLNKKRFGLCLLSISFSALTVSVGAAPQLKGTVRIDGSSTVFPITEAIAEEFGKVQPKIRVNVGMSGTGGGFKKFLIGETDINNASRTIKSSEQNKAKENKLDYLELPVAFDGITVVINNENTWANSMTVAELKKIWEPGSQVKKWSDVRPDWPNEEIKLFGPGTDSGTFDYFTKVINGESTASRSDFNQSEDDNVIVNGVKGEKFSLGYFGYAYYEANKTRVKSVKIDNGKGAIAPTAVSINNGTYAPLSRPIFIYVNKEALKKSTVSAFVKFYINNAANLVSEVGYVPLTAKKYQELNQSL